MILYRCGTNCPMEVILPSNWAYSSVALEYYIDRCNDKMIECGNKIFVIKITDPAPALIGKYFPIRYHKAPTEASLPFGNDGNGWWSFNIEYSGPFEVVDVLRLKGLTLDDIDELDSRYQKEVTL